MTMPVRSTPHFSIPASQNTAPVAEFRCLFTHDLRRKQKRWQDGFVRFHTFNSRVMLYDTARNFLGDTYYKDNDELHEGDELTLDKGIMVEVAEAVGVTQTDLTPLFEKKPKEASPRRNAPPGWPIHTPAGRTGVLPSTPHLKHKSLNALLGSSRGPIGKAQPPKSPYEMRREKEKEKENQRQQGTEWGQGRAAKRQKTEYNPVAARPPVMAGQQPVMQKSLPAPPKPAQLKKPVRQSLQRPTPMEVITIDSETDHQDDHGFSDVTLPDTPPRMENLALPPKAKPIQPHIEKPLTPKEKPLLPKEKPKEPIQKPVPRRQGKTMQPRQENPVQPRQEKSPPNIAKSGPKLPKGKIPLPGRPKTPPPPPLRPSSPPVSASNRLCNVEFAIESAKKPTRKPSPPESPHRNPQAKSLRLARSKNRGGMLLCQKALQQRAKDAASVQTADHSKPKDDLPRNEKRNEAGALPSNGDTARVVVSKSARGQDERIGNKASKSSKTKSTSKPPEPLNPPPPEPSPPSSPDAFEDMELVYGRLDERLIPGPPKPKPKPPPRRKQDLPPPKLPSNLHPKPPPAPPKEDPHPISNPITKPHQPMKPSSPPKIQAAQPPRPQTTKHSPLRLRQPPKPPPPSIIDPIEDTSTPTDHQSPNPSPRKLRRIQSANDADIPSPNTVSKANSNAASGSKTTKPDPRRKFQRTGSLNIGFKRGIHDGDGSAAPVVELEPEPDGDVGAWSTEAGDLFDWNPPGRDGQREGVELLADR